MISGLLFLVAVVLFLILGIDDSPNPDFMAFGLAAVAAGLAVMSFGLNDHANHRVG